MPSPYMCAACVASIAANNLSQSPVDIGTFSVSGRLALLLFVASRFQRLSIYGMLKPTGGGASVYRLRVGVRSVRDVEASRTPLRSPYGMLPDIWSCVLILARRITEDDLCLRLSSPGMIEENRLRTDGGSSRGETETSLDLSVWNICSGGVDGFRDESRFIIDDAM